MIGIIYFILILFFGFIIGRIGDKFGGYLNFFHHWIYGLILFILGFFINYGIYLSSFGLGLFVSDLKDFINLKFYGPDLHKQERFWGFD
jgi:hypothetical protein